MGHPKYPETLAKFLEYALGRKPDEFGLVPDPDGYVKIKELIKAFGEEEGWRHVRRAGIDEVLISVPNPPVEVTDNRIRAVQRDHLFRRKPADTFPKLLYTCVRKKAHAVVVDRGVSPMGEREHLVLTTDPALAERIGRRIDSAPVMLIVNVQAAIDAGVRFLQAAETVFLASYLPVGSFTAPPLPKDKEDATAKKKEKPVKERDPIPGSFFLDAEDLDPEQKKRKAQRRKQKDVVRDKERKKSRHQKNKLWPE